MSACKSRKRTHTLPYFAGNITHVPMYAPPCVSGKLARTALASCVEAVMEAPVVPSLSSHGAASKGRGEEKEGESKSE